MTQQFYVSPEQLMKDRADFARKGIGRGRSVVVMSCRDGIALVAENPSPSLHKLGEIYDRIAFAAVGKYNEFESLRQAGVRYADVRGYSYAREDVTARGLASVYAQSLGAVFTAESKPFEVELVVAEVGRTQQSDHLYRLMFDGSIADESDFVVMGGAAEAVVEALRASWSSDLSLREAVPASARSLRKAGAGPTAGDDAASGMMPDPSVLEVAFLERDPDTLRGSRRAFRRVGGPELTTLLQHEQDS
ncbi:proteasome subunit alpha [Arthrobacter echini]|uniref:Proteasome subunit alpha n=1 Tax=Arthrobacter echini TaxID=1529066 RepID=A0A4S5E770_9MICC|nr:proteasome subunit alpha [Arthrobacter echini]THJ67323.1 proteasome subunit alpha [Arthrobacter echini]